MWLYVGMGVSIGIWIVLGIYVFSEIKKTYDKKGIFTNKLLNFWYAMWAFHHIPVFLAALTGIWLIPVNRAVALTAGVPVFVVGICPGSYDSVHGRDATVYYPVDGA